VATIAAAGFSLGGNVLLKYLGEHKYPTAKVIQAAVAVSVPVHLADCSTELAKPHNRVYLKRFMKSLKRKMLLKSRQFHDSIDKRALDKVKDFYDFDDLFTAPIHGFDSASHYYEVCSSIQYLPDISTPALLINALNDPFLAPSCHPKNIAAGSKYLHFENPVQGGHVGFAYNHLKQSYWAETRIMSFIHEHS
jgi:predicted alpha/beta-fold hydrolase